MPFQHGKSTKVMFGAYDLTSFFNEASMSAKVDPAETTTFGKNSKTYIRGLNDGTISLRGLFDSTAVTGPDVNLSAALGSSTDSCLTVGWEGSLAAGKRVSASHSVTTSYEVSAPVADVVSASAEFQATGGMNTGVSLKDLAAETASTNGTGVNDTGQASAFTSANGGFIIVHVTAVSGTTPTLSIALQDSDDNATFLATSPATATVSITAIGSYFVDITDTSLRRFVRYASTIGGTTPSFTYTVAFVRL